MSKTLRVGIVCEGPTDKILIDGLIEAFLGSDDFVSTEIQPPFSALLSDFGEHGGGWFGVRRWCIQAAANHAPVSTHAAFLNHDVVVIHLDADVAREPYLASLGLSKNCPPASGTCDAIRADLTRLLGGAVLPPQLVFCIPSDSTEAWVIAAVDPALASRNTPWECYQKPETLLPQAKVGNTRRNIGKSRQSYDRNIGWIIEGWGNVVALCSEARRFENDLRAVLV